MKRIRSVKALEKKCIVPFNAPLNSEDTEKQTYGYRQNNPDICGNNGLENVCAFVRTDCICQRPSRTWKKQYYKLLEQDTV